MLHTVYSFSLPVTVDSLNLIFTLLLESGGSWSFLLMVLWFLLLSLIMLREKLTPASYSRHCWGAIRCWPGDCSLEFQQSQPWGQLHAGHEKLNGRHIISTFSTRVIISENNWKFKNKETISNAEMEKKHLHLILTINTDFYGWHCSTTPKMSFCSYDRTNLFLSHKITFPV